MVGVVWVGVGVGVGVGLGLGLGLGLWAGLDLDPVTMDSMALTRRVPEKFFSLYPTPADVKDSERSIGDFGETTTP